MTAESRASSNDRGYGLYVLRFVGDTEQDLLDRTTEAENVLAEATDTNRVIVALETDGHCGTVRNEQGERIAIIIPRSIMDRAVEAIGSTPNFSQGPGRRRRVADVIDELLSKGGVEFRESPEGIITRADDAEVTDT